MTADVTLPEGRLLALYTDGLIEARDRDIDPGMKALREALARPAPSLDSLCDAVLQALPPNGHADDVRLAVPRLTQVRALRPISAPATGSVQAMFSRPRSCLHPLSSGTAIE
ncbi:hypothetical protein ABB07_05770 [Streptomyces incarnatus]|uniref:PPM-type phosphatase domain-containing protein n=1 Tax=Streptomyces incarnatus TaxID=665007 RepID=A0ABN4GCD8_9ACTN|nr:SpoIIE family protein phosphatase [Streptomyces incarnatus]AKJ09542.1 hypothetical protein ABB07_05770 [Streptomyces incarnatus]